MHELERLLNDPKLPLYVSGISTVVFSIAAIIRAEYKYRNFRRQSLIVTDPFEKARTFALKSANPDSVK